MNLSSLFDFFAHWLIKEPLNHLSPLMYFMNIRDCGLNEVLTKCYKVALLWYFCHCYLKWEIWKLLDDLDMVRFRDYSMSHWAKKKTGLKFMYSKVQILFSQASYTFFIRTSEIWLDSAVLISLAHLFYFCLSLVVII